MTDTEKGLLQFSYVCRYPVFGSERPDDSITSFQEGLGQTIQIVQPEVPTDRAEVDKLNHNFHVLNIKGVKDDSGKFSDSRVVTISYHSGKTVDILVPASAIKTY